jgi:autotransporter-associated beta strand protein
MNLLVGTTPVEIRAANSAGLARDITLSGVLSGAGGFNKTGAGRLTLTASNTYTGPVTITEGVLDVSGSTAATSVTTVDLGGTLAGTGTVNGPIVLQNGGVISPAADNEGTLNAASLTWNAGGILRIQVGASSDRLALTGALTKGSAGTFPVAFQFGAYPVAGTVLTLATFGSTDFAATDFTATGGLFGTFAIAGNALTFTVKDPPGTAYKQWLEQYSLPLDARGVADDPDFDGSSNLLEFVLAGNPAVAGAGGIQTIKVTVGQEDYPALAFVRRTQVGDTELEVRASADLSFQTNLGTVLVSATPRGDGSEDVIFRSSVPLTQLPRQFLRLFVSIPNF